MYSDPDPDPNSTPDPTPFFIDFKDAKKIYFHLQSKKLNIFLKFCVNMIFCRHYINPLNTFMRKGKDPEPNPYL
jgi:hypothetical protein